MNAKLKLIGGLLTIALLVFLSVEFPVLQWTGQFVGWVRGQGVIGVLVYVVVYVVATVAFLPGSIFTLGAGFLYGPLWGMAIVSPASVIGAALSFLIGRFLARETIEKQLKKRVSFQKVDHAIGREAFKIILLLRLSPIFPFNILNYALGLTRARFGSYVLASFLGMLPGTFMYVYFGSLLTTVQQLFSRSVGSESVGKYVLYGIGLIATVVVTIYITRVARRALQAELNGTPQEISS